MGFAYIVRARIGLSTGTGVPWEGEIVIGQRADSSYGLELLKDEVIRLTTPLLHAGGVTPSGRLELVDWGPKQARY